MATHLDQLALFADNFGWVQLVFLVVVFVIWVINNLLGEKAKLKPKPQRGQMPRPDIAGMEPQAEQHKLAGEIEEFLKRATQKRQDKSRRKQPKKIVVTAVAPPSKPARRLVEAPTEQMEYQVKAGRSVDDQVRDRLNTQKFAERASRLVDEDIAQDDAEREAHMRQVFEHKLGRLADTSAVTASPTTGTEPTKLELAAASVPLASLLTNPQNLKQAIVLNEILSRPEHRW
jgi:hypothetical protein